MIELRRLRAFVAIVEEQHVTRAAERLGVQQPSLTRLLQGLEAELGVQLVRRTPRGVHPTEAGTALLAEARAVLARAEAVPESVRRVARGEQGRLRIGFTSSAALHPVVSSALRRFRDTSPGIAMALDEAGTGELVDALLHDRLDAAFLRSPIGSVRGLRVDDVLDEPMIAALPAGHALAVDPETPLPLPALAGEAFILYRRPAGPGLHDAILAACHAAGFTPAVAQEAPRLTATLSLVAAGLGISIVPASMRILGGAGVAYRALTGCPGLSAPIHLATRQPNASPVLARFRTLVRHATAEAHEGAEG